MGILLIFATTIAAIIAVGIAALAKLGVVLGTIVLALVILFPFFANQTPHPRFGWFIWGLVVSAGCIVAYSGWSAIIFALWAYFAYQWRNINGPRPFTISEVTRLFSWRRADRP